MDLRIYTNEVLKVIIEEAKNKEIAFRYGESFGKRPDIVNYPNDVLNSLRNGATSFHFSEEIWKDPLEIATVKNLEKIRTGWDLIIDVDGKLPYTKELAYLVLEALKFYDLDEKVVGVKFSGGSGFHICIPWEAFPKKLNDIDLCEKFPEIPRKIMYYLRIMIKESFKEALKKHLGNVAITDPYKYADIDPALLAPRHMYRGTYSINEKKGFVSAPLYKPIEEFDVNDYSIEKILEMLKKEKPRPFIKRDIEKGCAKKFLIQSTDYDKSTHKEVDNKKLARLEKKIFEEQKIAIKNEEMFPPCIRKIICGLQDGKKISVFILINFLRGAGWDLDDVKNYLLEWNKKNPEPLKEGYIIGQINYAKKSVPAPPPNCDKSGYYKDFGICVKEEFCKRIKNPLNYTLFKSRMMNEVEESNKKKSRKKKDKVEEKK